MGFEVLERLRFLASLPLANTVQTEGGGIRVANNGIIPHPFTCAAVLQSLREYCVAPTVVSQLFSFMVQSI